MDHGPVIFTIHGEPASKSNQRRLVTIKGKPRMIKSQKALDYGKSFEAQCPKLDPLIEHSVYVVMTIYYGSRRPDIDGGASLILDLMQGLIYKNDRQVDCLIVTKELDRDCPRAEIEVRKYEPKEE